MFDLLAHAFTKTEITHNEHGAVIKEPKKSNYKNGHFSLDLTFLCIVVILIMCYFLYKIYKNYIKNKVLKQYELTSLRSQLDVERAPLGRAPQNCAVTQTGI